MNIKERLQRLLQMVEDAERVGTLAEIERDIILAELREAYTELKFGAESGELKVENQSLPTSPIAEVAETDDESDEDNEVEVELIFDEEEIVDSSEEVEDSREEVEENLSTLNSQLSTPAVEPVAEPVAVKEEFSTLNTQHSTPKRSALLSLYEEESAPILGEQFHEAPSVADTIACPKGVAESAPVASLREAIGVADKFMLIRELFGGDGDAYEQAISALDAQPSLDDCVIYIAENYAWSPNAQATKFVMELLQRRYN